MEQVFFNVPLSKLEPVFKRWVKEAQTELQPTKVEPTEQTDPLLTRKETCELFKVNYTTLWSWTKKGYLVAYQIGNRVYYKRNEVMSAMEELKK